MKDQDAQGLHDSLGERTVLVIDDSEAVRTALDVAPIPPRRASTPWRANPWTWSCRT